MGCSKTTVDAYKTRRGFLARGLLPVLTAVLLPTCIVDAKQVLKPPPAHIIYSERSVATNRYGLCSETWPGGFRNVLRLRVVGQYRIGDDVRSPQFSPDGRKLLFLANHITSSGQQVRTTDDGVGLDLWLLDLRTNRAHPLTSDGNGYVFPRWSPDGRHICAISLEGWHTEHPMADHGGPSVLYVWSVFSNRRQKLADNAWNPTWYHDSRRVLFEGTTADDLPAILSVDIAERKPRVFLRPKTQTYLGEWSPQGRYLAYSEFQPNVNGYNLSIISGSGNCRRSYLSLQLPILGEKWSPDGKRIAFVESIAKSPGGDYESRLKILDIASGRLTELLVTSGDVDILGWSHHGDWITIARPQQDAILRQQLDAIHVSSKTSFPLIHSTAETRGFSVFRESCSRLSKTGFDCERRLSVRRPSGSQSTSESKWTAMGGLGANLCSRRRNRERRDHPSPR